jgi:hypothetical protein
MPMLQPFPGCCGAMILTSFYGAPDHPAEYEIDKNGYSTSRVKFTGKQQIANELLRLEKMDKAVFAILNEAQMQTTWPETLHEFGFVFIRGWNNSVHLRSPCYLFVRFVQGTKEGWTDEQTKTPPKQWAALEAKGDVSKAEPKAARAKKASSI